MLLYALCTATTQVYYSYDVFFVARFVFLSEWNEVMCVCIHPASLFPALPWLSFVSSGGSFIREDEVNYCVYGKIAC